MKSLNDSNQAVTPAVTSEAHHGGLLHQEKQIKGHHIDYVKFSALNLGFHAIIDFTTYPFDLLRTRMQLQSSAHSGMHAFFPPYKNTLHGLQTVWQHEGVRGLYKGFLFSEIGWSAFTFFNFVSYEYFKDVLQSAFPATSKSEVFGTTFLAGALASFAGLFFTVPTEIVQQRLQLQGSAMKEPLYRGAADCFRKLWRDGGLNAFYRGSAAMGLRDSLSSAVWWGSYEITKYWLHDHDPRAFLHLKSRKAPEIYTEFGVENEDPIIQILGGVVGSVCTCIVSTPIDVVKTRLQTQDLVNSVKSTHYRSTTTFAIELIRQEGFRVLFRGFTPAIIVSLPYALAGVLIYEYAKKWCLKIPPQ